MKKLIVITSLLLATQFAQAHPFDKKDHGKRQPPTAEQRVEHMTKKLSLTEEQAAKVTKVMQSHEKDYTDLSAKLQKVREKERQEIEAILTAEQKEKIASRKNRFSDDKKDVDTEK